MVPDLDVLCKLLYRIYASCSPIIVVFTDPPPPSPPTVTPYDSALRCPPSNPPPPPPRPLPFVTVRNHLYGTVVGGGGRFCIYIYTHTHTHKERPCILTAKTSLVAEWPNCTVKYICVYGHIWNSFLTSYKVLSKCQNSMF